MTATRHFLLAAGGTGGHMLPAYALAEVRLIVVSATPKGVVFIDENTEIELLPEYQEPQDARRTDVTYDDLGGLGETIDQLREMVELPLRYPELFRRLGVDPPRGVLLHGPPGTGKTSLIKALAQHTGRSIVNVPLARITTNQELMDIMFDQVTGRHCHHHRHHHNHSPPHHFHPPLLLLLQSYMVMGDEVCRSVSTSA